MQCVHKLSNEQLLMLKNMGLQKSLLDMQVHNEMQALTQQRAQWVQEVCAHMGTKTPPEQFFEAFEVNLQTGEVFDKHGAANQE
jgi:hypothetical protein